MTQDPRGPAAHNVGDDDPTGDIGPGSTAGPGAGDPTVADQADPALLPAIAVPGLAEQSRRAKVQARRARRDARSDRNGAWMVRVLSSPAALAVTVVVALGGLMLAFYVALAQINLTDCLADYNEQAAKSTKARADAAAQDRQLDLRERAVDYADRRLKRIDDEAINTALASLGTTGQKEAFEGLLRQRKATAVERESNDMDRGKIANERSVNELRRAQNPLPAPPSQQCH